MFHQQGSKGECAMCLYQLLFGGGNKKIGESGKWKMRERDWREWRSDSLCLLQLSFCVGEQESGEEKPGRLGGKREGRLSVGVYSMLKGGATYL